MQLLKKNFKSKVPFLKNLIPITLKYAVFRANFVSKTPRYIWCKIGPKYGVILRIIPLLFMLFKYGILKKSTNPITPKQNTYFVNRFCITENDIAIYRH
jgi:hypothetical protein